MALPALDVLRALCAYTGARDMPPPAALIGDWWDADAVIAPSIEIIAGAAPPDDPDGFWFGYLGFPAYGGSSPARPRSDGLPGCAGGVVDGVLVLREGTWTYRTAGGTSEPPAWVRTALDAAPPESAHSPAAPAGTARWMAPDHDPHVGAVESCLDAIRAGEVYQACVCTHFSGTLTGPPADFFRAVTAATVPSKSAFLQGDWGAVASFSPETFLRRRGERVTSSPIKGTLPAHADPALLAASTKDVAENVMIVDLVRNDLGRVARTGSVRVRELLTITPAPGVWHLVSSISAELDDDLTTSQLLEATFPPASVTGTPKLRALELLAGWEGSSRGVYCGAVGMAGPGRDLDLNVAIRTVAVTPDGAARLGVGGGITIDSDPEREWQECLHKAASIVGYSEW